jgi:hypothetical protein
MNNWSVISGTPKEPLGWICNANTYSEAKEKASKYSPAFIIRGNDWGNYYNFLLTEIGFETRQYSFKAKTLRGALCKAQRRAIFANSDLFLDIEHDNGETTEIAVKYNQGYKGSKWQVAHGNAARWDIK